MRHYKRDIIAHVPAFRKSLKTLRSSLSQKSRNKLWVGNSSTVLRASTQAFDYVAHPTLPAVGKAECHIKKFKK
jgi:hypothetical protein